MAQTADPAPADPEEIPSIPQGVTVTTLDNGLILLLREDHSAPVVSVQAWCKTGSINEGKWLGAGLSHMLEHMLFKGTRTRGAGRIDQEVQEAGGYMNAYTSFDRTVYWINVPNTGARVAIDILADVMQHASLPPEEMAREKQVILREMDMNQDDPSRRASRRLFETAYMRSPYRFPVIGYPDIYHQLEPADISDYYAEKYIPNNMFFVVVGDFQPDAVIGQLREAFAKTPARALPMEVIPDEPRQTTAREVIEEAPIQLGHLHFSWHIPDLRHADIPALDVLAILLGGGRSSRLYQEIRERQGLANSIDAWTYNPGNPGLFGVSAVFDPERFASLRQAILCELDRITRGKVAAHEISKAIKQSIAGTLAVRKTMQGQAQDLGANWLAANDLNFSERYLASLKRVTAADLQRVARTYLNATSRTLYALLPSGTIPLRRKGTADSTDFPIQLLTLPNGLRLVLKEDHRLPFVEFRAVLRGGVLAETPETSGITQLMARMLLQGTKKRSANEIASEIESVGGSIDTFGGNNSFGLSLETMSDDFDAGLALAADVLLHPTFPEGPIDREKEIQLSMIRGQKDHLLQAAGRAMRRALFGTRSYGLDAMGTEQSVSSLNRARLDGFFRGLTRPENAVIALFGDIDCARARETLEKHFGGWSGNGAGVPQKSDVEAKAFPGLQKVTRVNEIQDKKQAVLLIGFPGTTLHHPDRFALELLQEACSDLGSRLFLRIRENLGLAYYVGAQNFLGIEPGYMAFYAGTAPEKLARVEEELIKEAELLRREGLSAAELQRAKAKVIGQKKIARQDLGGLASVVALDELYGLGYLNNLREDALIEAVTAGEVQAAAEKYLDLDRFVVATIGPASGALQSE